MSPRDLATRVGRRLARAYHLACAREDVHNLGLRTPVGVWFCDRCRLLVFERVVWRDHLKICTGCVSG